MLTAVSILNEAAQKLSREGYAAVNYEDTGRRGPDHAPTYAVRCEFRAGPNSWEAEATAPSKKAAKTAAAEMVVAEMGSFVEDVTGW